MPCSFQFSRQRDSLGSAPAVSKDDDAGGVLFFCGQCPVVVEVKASQNLPVGLLPVTILKSLYIHGGGVLLAKMLSNLDRAMNQVIVLDEPSYEADDHGRRGCNRSPLALAGPGESASPKARATISNNDATKAERGIQRILRDGMLAKKEAMRKLNREAGPKARAGSQVSRPGSLPDDPYEWGLIICH